MSAAEVLVLVNGKRRHTAATLNINGINTGAAPADLDLIPISAIDHVEVLRDGAAAQYGSDAIAGVINVILKADTSGTSVTNAGLGYDGKKQTVQQSLNKGFEIGNGGIVQLALDAAARTMTTRPAPTATPTPRPMSKPAVPLMAATARRRPTC